MFVSEVCWVICSEDPVILWAAQPLISCHVSIKNACSWNPQLFCIFDCLQAMRRETGDPKWDYDPVDVTDFLISQFKEGDLVEGLDTDSRRWRKGRILKVPQSGMTKDDRPLLNS